MVIKPFFFCLLIILVCCLSAHAQSTASVNPVTGAANVVIPVGNFHRGSIGFPISLVYSGSGIRPTDVEGSAGIGWNLVAGGQVTRVLRGLPDDCQQDVMGNIRLGWMYNTIQSSINTFPIYNNGTVNCTYQQSDLNDINSNFPYTIDTEPDLFYVSAPGLNCELVFDQSSGTFKPVVYQDLQITYGTDPDHTINTFTIINNAGTKYIFNKSEWNYMKDSTTTGVAPAFFTKAYNQYQYGVSFKDKWFLTSITDVNENQITLSYTTASAVRGSQDSVKLYLGGSTTASLQYITYQRIAQVLLNTVLLSADEDSNTTNQTLTFSWTNTTGYGIYATGQFYSNGFSGAGHVIGLNYSEVNYTRPSGKVYTRNFLRSVADLFCSSPLNYTFSYAAETYHPSSLNYSTALPDSGSTQLDYWGYYSTTANTGNLMPAVYASATTSAYPPYIIQASLANPSYNYPLSGSYRSVDTTVMYDGALTQITNAMGGSTTIAYQSNDYYDVSAARVVKGGGIRVQQITDYDGINTANNIVRNFTYNNPSDDISSSGKPISLPQFAFAMPYSGSATGFTLWTNATARSAYDLSTEDHTIMYEYERESVSGAGSTLSQFYLPATNWDASAAPDCSGCSTEWYPTVNLVASASCPTYGPAASQPISFPFIPNPNYDFERGLPRMVQTFTDINPATNVSYKTSETDYTYQRTVAPTPIYAFSYDDISNSGISIRGYNKYTQYYNAGELVAKQVNTIFDSSPTHGQSAQTTVSNTYNTIRRTLSLRQAVNSDGSTVTQNYSYIKDYSPNAGSNPNINALYNLQQQNVNWPVESYTTVLRGGTTYYTHAALMLFAPFTTIFGTVYRPSQQRSWVQPNGLTSFTPFSINTTSQTINYDSNYFPVANFTTYDYNGVLATGDDANNNVTTQLYDHISDKVVATFNNAAVAEVWFADFDSDTYELYGRGSTTGTTSYSIDRNGKNALVIPSNGSYSFTLTKNAQTLNYIFSMWLNGTAGSTVTITFTPTTGTAVTRTLSPSAAWTYFEPTKVAVTGMSGTITVKITTSANVSLDDILCYPENGEANTVAYDNVQFFKICQTNTNGVSAYYNYDTWGRLLYAYDQDRNILQKNSYVTQADAQSFGTGVITYPGGGTITTNGGASFVTTQPNPCVTANNTYTWNFGDHSTPVATSTPNSPAHYYPVAGPYTVSLAISSALFGNFNTTLPITVVSGPNTNLTYTNGTTAYGNIANISFYTGTYLVASFTPPLSATAQVPKGAYTVKITMASGAAQYPAPAGGTGGYGSIVVTGDHTAGACLWYLSTNTYSFSIDLSNCDNLNFNVLTSNNCD